MVAGIGIQVLQQIAGINTVMYFLPVLLQTFGISNRAALLLSLIPAMCNALGTIIGMKTVDTIGRRKLLLTSIAGVVCMLAALAAVFHAAELQSPAVHPQADLCPGHHTTCSSCISSGCSYCGIDEDLYITPGACIKEGAPDAREALYKSCQHALESISIEGNIHVYTKGCPSKVSLITIIFICMYLLAFSPGLGPIPWVINSEIFPEDVRGVANGITSLCNWVTNALISQVFLAAMKMLGGGVTFGSIALLTGLGGLWAHRMIPETKGLTFEQIQHLFS